MAVKLSREFSVSMTNNLEREGAVIGCAVPGCTLVSAILSMLVSGSSF